MYSLQFFNLKESTESNVPPRDVLLVAQILCVITLLGLPEEREGKKRSIYSDGGVSLPSAVVVVLKARLPQRTLTDFSCHLCIARKDPTDN